MAGDSLHSSEQLSTKPSGEMAHMLLLPAPRLGLKNQPQEDLIPGHFHQKGLQRMFLGVSFLSQPDWLPYKRACPKGLLVN